MSKAIYPGSFDPITNGHLDIIYRAAKIFDEVVVLVANNDDKKSLFTKDQKVEMIQETIKDLNNVTIDSFDGLTVEYAKKIGATALIRGLRVVSDFEYEWKLAATNTFINKDIETVFFMASNDNNFISSSIINELYHEGIDISSLVPNSVIKMYKKTRR